MSTAIPMRFVSNRSMMQLIYKQPFLDWLRSVDPHPIVKEVDELREDNDSYLIPDFDDPADAVKWVEMRWQFLFESILLEWFTDESLWPQKLTLKMFRSWFDIQIHSMLWDLSEEPILTESFEEDLLVDYEVSDGLLH